MVSIPNSDRLLAGSLQYTVTYYLSRKVKMETTEKMATCNSQPETLQVFKQLSIKYSLLSFSNFPFFMIFLFINEIVTNRNSRPGTDQGSSLQKP